MARQRLRSHRRRRYQRHYQRAKSRNEYPERMQRKRRRLTLVVVQTDVALELFDLDVVTDGTQHLRPVIGHLLRRKPRAGFEDPVSAVISAIGDDSVHALDPGLQTRTF